VFGTDNSEAVDELILAWTAEQGLGGACVSSIELSIGAAVIVTLSDGSKIFVKVWPGTADARSLAAQMEVQTAMAARDFPASAVLTKLSALGAGWAVSMEYNQAGVLTDARVPGVRGAMAVGLVHFVAEAEAYRNLDGLPTRLLPPEGSVWPEPHNALFDFKATARGAEWIDEIAHPVLPLMRSVKSRTVVGHHDWSAKNMRMNPDGIAVIYDWDAVFLDHEAFILGSAATHFPVTWALDVPETPAIGEVDAFIREYEQARGAAFTTSELAEIEAGATYARAYKARCEHAIDHGATRWRGSSRESLESNGPFQFNRWKMLQAGPLMAIFARRGSGLRRNSSTGLSRYGHGGTTTRWPLAGVLRRRRRSALNGNVGGRARADFEVNRHRARFVDQVMAVAGAFRKGCAIAGAQHRIAAIFDQRRFAFEQIDEFVFGRMPVALARPIARRQVHEIDPEINEPAGVAQPLPHAFGTGCVGRRIKLPWPYPRR
jgi:hypothetical protein